MIDSTPTRPGLSPLGDQRMDARFDGGRLSSDAGLLLLREVENRWGLSKMLTDCILEWRIPMRCDHRLDEIIRFRVMTIAAGYEDGNDCNRLRIDPVFKMAAERQPIEGAEPCSPSTVSRPENRPSRTTLLRLATSPHRPRFANGSACAPTRGTEMGTGPSVGAEPRGMPVLPPKGRSSRPEDAITNPTPQN